MSNYETNPVGALQVCNQGYQEKNAKKSYYASLSFYTIYSQVMYSSHKKNQFGNFIALDPDTDPHSSNFVNTDPDIINPHPQH